MTSFRSLRCSEPPAFARISINVMFGGVVDNSGASLISPIRRASFVQSSSESCPERSTCSGTATRSQQPHLRSHLAHLQREDGAAKLLRTEAARAKSIAAVELCVGSSSDGQVQVVPLPTGDAADRNAGYRPDVDDVTRGRAYPGRARRCSLCRRACAAAEHVVDAESDCRRRR